MFHHAFATGSAASRLRPARQGGFWPQRQAQRSQLRASGAGRAAPPPQLAALRHHDLRRHHHHAGAGAAAASAGADAASVVADAEAS